LAYLFAGAVVASVMLCLSEMVSVRPLAGALVEFPKLYFDPALGFATGIVYWFVGPYLKTAMILTIDSRLAYTFSAATLTVSAAMLLDFWDFGIWQGILVSLVPIWIFNFFGPVLVR
jgi:amino acid permease